MGIRASWGGCNQGKLPGRSDKLKDCKDDPPKRGKEEWKLYLGDVACVHTLGEQRVRLTLGKLGTILSSAE